MRPIRFVLFALLTCIFIIPLLALAQASQPTSAPAVTSFTSWWATWGVLVIIPAVLVILASIVTVLRKRKDDPAAQKAVSILETIIEIIGILPRRGTGQVLKAPFTRSRHMKELAAKNKAMRSPKAPLACLLVFFLLAPSISGCCVFRGDCKSKAGQIATLVVNCSVEAVKTLVAEMLPAVIAIITSGGANWAVLLDQLKGAGFDALACSLQQAGQEIQNMAMKSGPIDTHYLIKMKATPQEAQAKINKYLSEMKSPDGKKVFRVEFKK